MILLQDVPWYRKPGLGLMSEPTTQINSGGPGSRVYQALSAGENFYRQMHLSMSSIQGHDGLCSPLNSDSSLVRKSMQPCLAALTSSPASRDRSRVLSTVRVLSDGVLRSIVLVLHLHGVAMVVPDTCIALPEIVTSLSAGELRLKRKNKHNRHGWWAPQNTCTWDNKPMHGGHFTDGMNGSAALSWQADPTWHCASA